MYKIEAVIRPQLLEAVRESLSEAGVSGITALDARGAGSTPEVPHTFRGSSYAHTLALRTLVIVVVAEEHLELALDTIQKAAFTGEVGDGKIFVTALSQVVRIRTNERGAVALS